MDDLITVTLEWDKSTGMFKYKFPLRFYRTYDEGVAVFAFDTKRMKYIKAGAADDLSDCQRFALYQPEFDIERFMRLFGTCIPQLLEELNKDITYMLLEPIMAFNVCITLPQELVEEMLANGELPWLD